MNKTEQILNALLTAPDGEYVSGEFLSDSLNVSRVAVWEYIEKLKKQGFQIEALRKKGYRIVESPNQFSEYFFKYLLKDLECEVFSYESLDSTNTQVLRLMSEGVAPTFAVIAKNQSKGRAVRGKEWKSSEGALLLSLVCESKNKNAKIALEKLAKKIAQFLKKDFNTLCVQKENTLLYKSKKICGVLCETFGELNYKTKFIFGIGIDLQKIGLESKINEIAARVISEILSDKNFL